MTMLKHQSRMVLALLVAMLLILALAACEDPNGDTTDPGTGPGVESPGATPGTGF